MFRGSDLYLLELRHAIRALRSKWVINLVAFAALAVALTATMSVLVIVDTVLIRPLPFARPDQLVFVGPLDQKGGLPQRVRPSELKALEGNVLFDGVFGYAELGSSPSEELQDVRQVAVTAPMLQVLGVKPVLGRAFARNDEQDVSASPVLVSEGLWKRYWGGDRTLTERVVTLGDTNVRVVGVLPGWFNFPDGASVWRLMPELKVDIRGIVAIARRGALVPPVPRFDLEGSTFATLDLSLGLRPAYSRLVPLVVILGGAMLLLLAAWVHLGLLRANDLIDRQRDLGLRLALGAPITSIYRGVVLENVLFLVSVGMLSALLTPAVVSQFIKLMVASDTTGRAISIDYRANSILAGLTLLGALAASYAPIRVISRAPTLKAIRSELVPSLRHGTWGRRIALGTQIAVVSMAVYASIVLLHYAQDARGVDLGFDPRGLLSVDSSKLTLSTLVESDSEPIQRLRHIPGVVSVAGGPRPVSRLAGRPEFVSNGRARTVDDPRFNAFVSSVSRGYFPTLRTNIVRGRDFEVGDDPRAVIVSERLERSIAQGQDLLVTGVSVGSGPASFPVVGIVRDVFTGMPAAVSLPSVYFQQRPPSIVIRAEPGVVDNVTAEVARIVARPGLRPDQVKVYRIQDSLDRLFEPETTRASVVGLCSVATLVLSVLAVFATAASESRRHLRQAAIRRALGGSTASLCVWFIRDLILAGLLGVSAGVAFGAVASRWLLPSISQPMLDWPAVALTTLTMLFCCLAVIIKPTWTIARANPARILKSV